jgi:hypothetical protein
MPPAAVISIVVAARNRRNQARVGALQHAFLIHVGAQEARAVRLQALPAASLRRESGSPRASPLTTMRPSLESSATITRSLPMAPPNRPGMHRRSRPRRRRPCPRSPCARPASTSARARSIERTPPPTRVRACAAILGARVRRSSRCPSRHSRSITWISGKAANRRSMARAASPPQAPSRGPAQAERPCRP